MKVVLAMIDSVFQNSLALDYIRGYALEDPQIAAHAQIELMIFPPSVRDEEIESDLLDSHPDMVGFSTYLWNIRRSLKIANNIRTINKDISILLGGVEVSYESDRVLLQNPFVDFVIEGEGEIPFRQLLKGFRGNAVVEGEVPGLWMRQQGRIIRSSSRQALLDLNEIPSPFTSTHSGFRDPKGNILYESYRGCAYSCAFCLYHRNGSAIRKLTLERIEQDLKAILASRCECIRFVDAMFNYDRKRTFHILGLLRGTDKYVEVEISAELLDDEMIEQFAACGVRHVDVGLQTTERMSLTEINRKWYRPDVFARNVRKLSSYPQMTVNVELIVGLPEDNLETFKRSLDTAISHGPDHVSAYRLLLFKGNELRSRETELGLLYHDYPPYSLISSKTFSSEDLTVADTILFAHFALFNSGLGRWAMKLAESAWEMKPSQLYDAFIEHCIQSHSFSKAQMIEAFKWYSVGNRFDRTFPKEFDIDVMKSLCEDFFLSLALSKGVITARTVSEILDYGYQMAKLDQVPPESAFNCAVDSTGLLLNPACLLREYSKGFFEAIGTDLAPDALLGDLKAVAFFIHPRFGPTSLALSETTNQVLKLCDGQNSFVDILDLTADYHKSNRRDIQPELYHVIEQMISMNIVLKPLGQLFDVGEAHNRTLKIAVG